MFRIDHYLGKETVQNLIALPLPTPVRPIWNRNFVDSVQNTAAEDGRIAPPRVTGRPPPAPPETLLRLFPLLKTPHLP